MKTAPTLIALIPLALALNAGAAHAQTPRMGGPMRHVMVSLDGTTLRAHAEPGADPLLQNYAETYTGAASVLTGAWYNAQYGWMIEGVWAPPAGAGLWIELVRADAGLETYAPRTFAPTLGAGGSPARAAWNGAMMHPWHAVRVIGGDRRATFRVYLGDGAGEPVPGFAPAEITLTWSTPAPACAADFNADAELTFDDVQLFIALHNSTDPRADLNRDAEATFDDVQLFIALYNAGC